MFDIQNYDIILAFIAFAFVFLLLFMLFKKKSMGVIDPLTMHLLWLSGNISFLVAYIDKKGLDCVVSLFVLVFVVYIPSLFYFLKPIHHVEIFQKDDNQMVKNKSKVFLIYLVSICISLYSKKPMFDFFLSNSVASWFLYRYIAIEGGNPFFRMLEMGVTPIFLYLTFYNIYITKQKKTFSLFVLFIYSVISILAGGRSFFLSLIFTYGGFVTFYRGRFLKPFFLKKINKIGSVFILISVILAMTVSSMYKTEDSFEDGVYIILNRVIATADGMEYYMKYEGMEKIPSGGYEYVMSIFGVYLKRVLNVEHKNVGHQLSELAIGGSLDFAQGSNYTLPLQVMVLGYLIMPLYVFMISFICAKMRNLRDKGTNNLQIVVFFLFMQSFTFAGDPEFLVLNMLSFFLVYYLIFYWLIKIKV